MKFGFESCRSSCVLAAGLFAMALSASPAGAQTLTSVFRFYGSTTEGDVIFGDGGYLFGTTNNYAVSYGGAIFKIRPDGTDLHTVYQLGATDGVSPNAGLLHASDGNYYSTTQYTGRGAGFSVVGSGTIFQLKTASGAPVYTTLHAFNPGTNEGSFELVVGAGYIRGSNLIEASDGFIYGITPYGGTNFSGTVYKFPLSNPTSTPTFYSFNAPGTDTALTNVGGNYPAGALIQASDGSLYGTAPNGGANGTGVVFKFDPLTETFTTVLDFSTLDSTTHTDCGTAPIAGVIEANGNLYGTTTAGGASGYGTVFKIPMGSSSLTCADVTFASFDGVNGFSPAAELIRDSRSSDQLLGTSVGTSTISVVYGNVYSVDISGDVPVITGLINFDSNHGATPKTRVLQSADGATLYGTTSSGGGDYCTAGTVWRYGSSGTDAGSPCPSNGGGSMTPAILLLLSTLGLARRFGGRHLTIERT